jgi:hypothetical protein
MMRIQPFWYTGQMRSLVRPKVCGFPIPCGFIFYIIVYRTRFDRYPVDRRAASGHQQHPGRKVLLYQRRRRFVEILSGRTLAEYTIGSGKTMAALHAAHLLETTSEKMVRIVAPSAMAASSIGGVTIHSFFGLINVTANSSREKVCREIMKRAPVVHRIQMTDVLIIDEGKKSIIVYLLSLRRLIPIAVSMLSDWLWTLIEYIASTARSHPQGTLFGGMQVVYIGDMLQLAPITVGDKIPWLFHSPRWRSSVEDWYLLTETIRQRDVRLATVLNHLRIGYIPKEADELIKSLSVDQSDSTTYLCVAIPTFHIVLILTAAYPQTRKRIHEIRHYWTDCHRNP